MHCMIAASREMSDEPYIYPSKKLSADNTLNIRPYIKGLYYASNLILEIFKVKVGISI